MTAFHTFVLIQYRTTIYDQLIVCNLLLLHLSKTMCLKKSFLWLKRKISLHVKACPRNTTKCYILEQN